MIAVTAATPWERAPLQCLGVPIWETGMGPVRTRSALKKRPAPPPDSVIVSAGFAGALQPGLRCGDLVMDPLESPIELAQSARDLAQSLGMTLHMGKIHSADRVIGAPREKRELGRSLRAAAVDMETAAIREWCVVNGATALAIRVVLDELDESLPEDLPADTSVWAGARYALARPARIPMLIRLGWRQKRAMGNLVAFLKAYLPSIPQLCENTHAEET